MALQIAGYPPALRDRPPLPATRVTRSGVVVIHALPVEVNLFLYAGNDFWLTIGLADPEGVPIDLTGATVRSQIRATHDATTISGQFAPTISGNVILLHLTSQVSAGLLRDTVWDCELDRGTILTVAFGAITMRPRVTR